jgi:hypothetical protein
LVNIDFSGGYPFNFEVFNPSTALLQPHHPPREAHSYLHISCWVKEEACPRFPNSSALTLRPQCEKASGLTPSRSYRKGDDEWRETDSLGADDALAMAELLRESYAWIKAQKRADEAQAA